MRRKLSKLVSSCWLLTFVGCFSVMRIPLPSKYETSVDPVTLEPVTKVVERQSCPNYPMCIYPSLHIRWHLLKAPFDEKMNSGGRVAGPFACILSCIGLPGDLVVDTIALPWDWNASDTAKCPLCDGRGCWNDPVPEDAPVEDVIIRVNGTRVH